MLQVSTADIVSYLEVRKNEIKFNYLPGKGKSVFFFSYRGFREFEGLINQDMLQL